MTDPRQTGYFGPQGDTMTTDESTAALSRPRTYGRPHIVCLCGSTRFHEAFQAANYRETMAGNVVLSVGFYPHSAEKAHGEATGCKSQQKLALDRLHLRKIDLADEVLVLNPGGYVGDSTRAEIAYAIQKGKPVRAIEPLTEVLAMLNAPTGKPCEVCAIPWAWHNADCPRHAYRPSP